MTIAAKASNFAGPTIPLFIPQTNPTPPDETDLTGRRTLTFSDQSDTTGPDRPIAVTS
jgi:hypothetical protein